MKKLFLVLILFLVVLSGCNGTSKEDENDGKNNEEDVEVVVDEKDEEEIYESDIGVLTVVTKKKGVDKTQVSGPFEITLHAYQVALLEVGEDYFSFFDERENVTVITIELTIENVSENTNTIYPDQSMIVTNTKEQGDSDLWLSDDLGGDYVGEVIKKGNVIFVLDSDAREISEFKFIIDGPIDENWDTLGEDIIFEEAF